MTCRDRAQRARPAWGMALAAGLTLAFACRFSEAPIARVDTPAPPTPTPSQAPVPGVIVATAPATPASPTQPAAACPAGSGSVPLPELSGQDSLAPVILSYLNQGGDPGSIASALEAAGRLPSLGSGAARLDFSGDGWQDLALSVQELEAQGMVRAGELLLFVCAGDRYQLAYSSPPAPDLNAPIIHAAQDLTGDGLSDLLIGRQACGAHTCAQQLEALLWNGATLENRLEGRSDDLPSPTIALLPNPAGSMDLAVTATGIASVGAGPFRLFTRVWSWSAPQGVFQVDQQIVHASSFRIHVLHDADDAARQGNYDGALALYQQVIADDTLDDWLAGAEGRANLSAYARYRRMLTILQLGDPESAEAELQALLAAFPAQATGSAYADLAQVFWSEYQLAQDQAQPLERACAAVQSYALAHRQLVLDPLYYGYANRTYAAEDLCPIGEDG